MGLQAALSLIIPKKVYFLLLPLREELKIALLWDEDCPIDSQKKQCEN